MKPSRSLEDRVDRLADPTCTAGTDQGPQAPEGRALLAWGEAVAAMHVEVDDPEVDDDWRRDVAAFRDAVLEYGKVLDAIDEA